MDDFLQFLETGPEHRFTDWPNDSVPAVAAGVYTIWRQKQLIYAGMSGRSLTPELIQSQRLAGLKKSGLYTRLHSHAGGRRSGDQFCVYVADRLVLPHLSPSEIQSIAAGEHSMDALVRTFIHENLTYRWVEVRDAAGARAVEGEIRAGALAAGKPLLNPLRSSG